MPSAEGTAEADSQPAAEERPVDEAELRQEIERTREQLGETVEQLAAKTDVKGRARAKAAELAGRAKSTTAQARTQAATQVSRCAGSSRARLRGRQKATAGGTAKTQLQARAAPVREATPEPVRRAVAKGASTAQQRRVPLAMAAVTLIAGYLDVPVVEETMIKLFYKPVSVLVSVLGGMLAGAIFKQVWKLAAREDDAPKATDARRGWREILPAAALQGAIYALVKAVIGRGTAEGTRKLTGVWPGKDDPQPEKAA